MNVETKLLLARIVLEAGRHHGYLLTGTLAMHAHGVAGTRESNRIEVVTNQTLDAAAVRSAVCTSLRAHGFEATVAWTSGFRSLAGNDQNSDILVTHPEHGAVTVRMSHTLRHLESQDISGMPVAALGTLVAEKLEAVQARVEAADFLDLATLADHLGSAEADSVIADYVVGITAARQLPRNSAAQELQHSIAAVSEVPDHAFTAFGVHSSAVLQVRASLLAMADRLKPADGEAIEREARIRAGLEELARALARATVLRLTATRQLSLLTDAQASTLHGTTPAGAVAAQRAADRIRELTRLGHPSGDGTAERGLLTQRTAEELIRITLELQRRVRLMQRQRAAEAAVRRADSGGIVRMVASDGGGLRAQPRRAPVAPRERRHAEAEAQWQQHRPETTPGYGGLRQ